MVENSKSQRAIITKKPNGTYGYFPEGTPPTGNINEQTSIIVTPRSKTSFIVDIVRKGASPVQTGVQTGVVQTGIASSLNTTQTTISTAAAKPVAKPVVEPVAAPVAAPVIIPVKKMTRKNLKSEFVAQGKRVFNNKLREQQRSVLQAGIERNKRLGPNAPPNGPQTRIGRNVPYKSAEKSVNGKTWEERERELEEEFNKQQNAREEQERTNEKERREVMLERERTLAELKRRRASTQLARKQEETIKAEEARAIAQLTAITKANEEAIRKAEQNAETAKQRVKAAEDALERAQTESVEAFKKSEMQPELYPEFQKKDEAEKEAIKRYYNAYAEEKTAMNTVHAVKKQIINAEAKKGGKRMRHTHRKHSRNYRKHSRKRH